MYGYLLSAHWSLHIHVLPQVHKEVTGREGSRWQRRRRRGSRRVLHVMREQMNTMAQLCRGIRVWLLTIFHHWPPRGYNTLNIHPLETFNNHKKQLVILAHRHHHSIKPTIFPDRVRSPNKNRSSRPLHCHLQSSVNGTHTRYARPQFLHFSSESIKVYMKFLAPRARRLDIHTSHHFQSCVLAPLFGSALTLWRHHCLYSRACSQPSKAAGVGDDRTVGARASLAGVGLRRSPALPLHVGRVLDVTHLILFLILFFLLTNRLIIAWLHGDATQSKLIWHVWLLVRPSKLLDISDGITSSTIRSRFSHNTQSRLPSHFRAVAEFASLNLTRN